MDPAVIYHQHFRAVYRFFYYRDVDAGDIEDLVQETFIRFFGKYSSHNLSDERITKTLYAIARNVWREWLRSIQNHRTVELLDFDGLTDTLADYQEDQSEEDWTAEREVLSAALTTLSPNIADVLRLRFLEGLTRSETAKRLDMKEDTVHTYQKRGIQQLQAKLGKPVPPSSHTK